VTVDQPLLALKDSLHIDIRLLHNREQRTESINSLFKTAYHSRKGVVIWQFTEAREVGFACLHPRHYGADINTHSDDQHTCWTGVTALEKSVSFIDFDYRDLSV
jgi:hypothetical protein